MAKLRNIVSKTIFVISANTLLFMALFPMAKLRNIARKIFFVISAFSLLFLTLYGIGRFLHFFPPVNAFRQLCRIYKIEKNTEEKNMDYSIALDKLADIYYEHDYEKWGTGKREQAIETFAKYNFQNTNEYATSLYKLSEYLLSEESGKYRATALLCRDCYLNLYNQKKITDDSRRNLVKIFISTFDFEISLEKKNKAC